MNLLTLASDSTLFGTMLMAVAVLMLGIMVWVHTRMQSRRREGEKLSPQEKVARAQQAAGMNNEMRRMMVELEELTRHFGSQLDAKSIRLEKLIREADQRIAQLSQLHKAPEDAVEGRSDQPPQARAMNGQPTAGYHENRSDSGDDPLASSIYEMADQGDTPIEIARRLGEHIGKVELILALRNQSP
jgi:hypothetical protein